MRPVWFLLYYEHVERFDDVSCAECNFLEFAITHGFSRKDINRLSSIYTKLNGKVDLNEVYEKSSTSILHNSCMAQMAVPIKYCKKCQKMMLTKRVFCEICQEEPLIKYCKGCGITKGQIDSIIASGKQSDCTLECNCPDVTPDGNVILHSLTCEGLICEFHRYTFCDHMIAVTPSTQLLLSEYCKRTSAISSLSDMNTARLWKHIGREDISEMMIDMMSNPNPSSSFVNELYNSKDSNEEMLFNINSKYCIFCVLYR